MDLNEKWDAGRVTKKQKLHGILRLLRIEHTIFSLPFAYAGGFLSGYTFTLKDIILILTAVIGLRTAGMTINNIADMDIDKKNPRTSGRPLITGVVTLYEAYMLFLVGSLIYFLSALLLNTYAFLFSPILYIITITYPYSKRYHFLPHLHLGSVLGSVIFGGAIAFSGDEVNAIIEALKTVPWIYLVSVIFWVAGFDTIYSIMDIEFDRKYKIQSIPARFGAKKAILIALIFYIISSITLIDGIFQYKLGAIAFATSLIGISLLYLQIFIAMKKSISLAFNMNLAFPLIVGFGVLLDLILP